jgi:Ca2+-binding EF-hand superfamily protein
LEDIDEDTMASIDQMIDRLFRKVDSNHNGFVDIEELYHLVKPLRPGKISLAECKQIVATFDENNDGQLDQEEFHRVVKHTVQQSMLERASDI